MEKLTSKIKNLRYLVYSGRNPIHHSNNVLSENYYINFNFSDQIISDRKEIK